MILSAEGLIRWAERYADLAEEQAAAEHDPMRRAELLQIAQTCRRVPAEPARDFREALQSFWFVHIAMHIEQFGWSISAGRFDQYLLPYYRHDLASGALTDGEAWELLLNLWVKFMENVDTRVKETVFQNLTLGGQDMDGSDQSNELSRLCLDATVALHFNQPALSVRWHAGIDPGLLGPGPRRPGPGHRSAGAVQRRRHHPRPHRARRDARRRGRLRHRRLRGGLRARQSSRA